MLLVLAALAPAFAGERFFAWSYGANTSPAGAVELEPTITVKTHDENGTTVHAWKHEVELEFGITDAIEGGIYLVGAQTDDGPFSIDGYKGRVRARAWPMGSRAVDLAGYLEYIGSSTFAEHGVEAKVILAHEGRKVRAALNLTGELEFEDGEVERVFEPTAGAVWRFNRAFALGGEGKLEYVFGEEGEGPYTWAGPTIHLAGPDGRVTWTTSVMGGLTAASRADAAIAARTIVGIEL